jgi:hypothetical protein
MTSRAHPPAYPHGELREVFPDVFFVMGTLSMPGPIPVRFSRNMTVIREGNRLVLVNSVRLSEDGLRQLDRLGKVTDVVRLAAFHGMDDPFYKERYGAKTWTVKGQRYMTGFKMDATPYHVADHEMHDAGELPLSGSKLYVIGSTPAEGLLLLERSGGILISGDSLQNWNQTDEYSSASWISSSITCFPRTAPSHRAARETPIVRTSRPFARGSCPESVEASVRWLYSAEEPPQHH